MMLLRNPVRDYAWGSVTAIPELTGTEPDGRPQAELWMGAHESAPSVLPTGQSLYDAVSADAQAVLGAEVAEPVRRAVPVPGEAAGRGPAVVDPGASVAGAGDRRVRRRGTAPGAARRGRAQLQGPVAEAGDAGRARRLRRAGRVPAAGPDGGSAGRRGGRLAAARHGGRAAPRRQAAGRLHRADEHRPGHRPAGRRRPRRGLPQVRRRRVRDRGPDAGPARPGLPRRPGRDRRGCCSTG